MGSPLDLLNHGRRIQMVIVWFRLRSFQPGDTAYARNFGSSTTNQQWLPGHITDCTGLLLYKIILDDGRSIHRHIHHIRLYFY